VAEAPPLNEAEQKRLALHLLLEAWEEALAKGIAPELLASTAIYAALTDMVALYGEVAVAQMIAALPARIKGGEFSAPPSPE
jgi:hypothetical protein